MPKESYTDNTGAEHPPGGKHHKVDKDHADELPSEEGSAPKKKNATSQKRAAKTEK